MLPPKQYAFSNQNKNKTLQVPDTINHKSYTAVLMIPKSLENIGLISKNKHIQNGVC